MGKIYRGCTLRWSLESPSSSHQEPPPPPPPPPQEPPPPPTPPRLLSPSSHQVLLRIHRLTAHHGLGVRAGQRRLQHLLDSEQAGCRGGRENSITALQNHGLVPAAKLLHTLQSSMHTSLPHAVAPSSLPLCTTHALKPYPFCTCGSAAHAAVFIPLSIADSPSKLQIPIYQYSPAAPMQCSCHRTGIPPNS